MNTGETHERQSDVYVRPRYPVDEPPTWRARCSCGWTGPERYRGITDGDWNQHVAPDDQQLRDTLRIHHPIMRSETGPFSGCRCGQVGLGQDVIAHVVEHLSAALNPRAEETA